jgi:hypothetical protein
MGEEDDGRGRGTKGRDERWFKWFLRSNALINNRHNDAKMEKVGAKGTRAPSEEGGDMPPLLIVKKRVSKNQNSFSLA